MNLGQLSRREAEVLLLYLQNPSYADIRKKIRPSRTPNGKLSRLSLTAIDNALCRAKMKLLVIADL